MRFRSKKTDGFTIYAVSGVNTISFAIDFEVFENEESARRWLKRPQIGLGGKVPLELLKTEAGAREVEDLLVRIDHGTVL